MLCCCGQDGPGTEVGVSGPGPDDGEDQGSVESR